MQKYEMCGADCVCVWRYQGPKVGPVLYLMKILFRTNMYLSVHPFYYFKEGASATIRSCGGSDCA